MPDNGTFVYVSHGELGSHAPAGEILVLKLDLQSGELARVQQISTTGQARPMAVSPDRRFLYVALHTEPYAVASYAIDGLSGRLTHLANAPLPGSVAYISTDRTGRFLLAASIPLSPKKPRSSFVCVSPIGPHGFVQPPHQIVRTEPKMHCILADPSNRYVFATSCDGDLVLRLIFDAVTGMFSPDPLPPVRVKPNAGPRHFVFHPNNRWLYLLNESEASIYAFNYDATTGELRELQIVSALPPDFEEDKNDPSAHAADLHLTPDGRFLYASLRGSSHMLTAFRVDFENGNLSFVDNFPTEKFPRGFNIDPLGRYLLAAGMLSHSMTTYAIDCETGSLTKHKQYPMGKGPNWIEIVSLP
jgi:6-phosphogluconolactonase